MLHRCGQFGNAPSTRDPPWVPKRLHLPLASHLQRAPSVTRLEHVADTITITHARMYLYIRGVTSPASGGGRAFFVSRRTLRGCDSAPAPDRAADVVRTQRCNGLESVRPVPCHAEPPVAEGLEIYREGSGSDGLRGTVVQQVLYRTAGLVAQIQLDLLRLVEDHRFTMKAAPSKSKKGTGASGGASGPPRRWL